MKNVIVFYNLAVYENLRRLSACVCYVQLSCVFAGVEGAGKYVRVALLLAFYAGELTQEAQGIHAAVRQVGEKPALYCRCAVSYAAAAHVYFGQ